GRWSSHVAPPSVLRMRPPSSMPASSRSASRGFGAIHRTCDVHGRGGKLHVGAEGRRRSASSSRQLDPPSSLRKIMLGSVPAYTAPSAGLTAREKTSRAGRSALDHDRPPSSLLHTPLPREPAKIRAGSRGSTATHWS